MSLPLPPLTAATQHHTMMMMCHWIYSSFEAIFQVENHQKDGSVSANFVGNTLTQSETIETYASYDVTSSRPRKTTVAFICQRWRDRKIILRAKPKLKFKNYESVQHRLQLSGIKKVAEFSLLCCTSMAHAKILRYGRK